MKLKLGLLALLFSIGSCQFQAPLSKGQDFGDTLKNRGMEEETEAGLPEYWNVTTNVSAQFSMDSDAVKEGAKSLRVDSRSSNAEATNSFTNLSQVLSAESWRGKKVRFRAAVKTAELQGDQGAQLWFRVDRPDDESGNRQVGAFDNMQNRSIRNDDWEYHEIVLSIDEDAERIVLGMFVTKPGLYWVDDLSLEEVSADASTTDMTDSQNADSKQTQANPYQMPQAVLDAFAAADNAPRQPFFTHWLWLPGLALVLFFVGSLSIKSEENAELKLSRRLWSGAVKLAFRFTFAYWVLYNFPTLLGALIPRYGARFSAWYSEKVGTIVEWVAGQVFQFKDELVPPNGSGDTTFNYIQVLTLFVLALVVSIAWTLIDRRRTDYNWSRDLLRSYLRYIVAFWMLSYGLAKVSWDSNQFPLIGEYQLGKTWGESSPMNVVWSFMGSSRPYTVFAGMGEVVGGLLLVFRRTTLLGALVVLGVMTNVMMLNYCYDVPVKLFSTHLMAMTVVVMLPDLQRLLRLLVLNRNVEAASLTPPYTNRMTIWGQRAFKAAVVIMLFAIPLGSHTIRQVKFIAKQAGQPAWFGQLEIAETQIDPSDGSNDSVSDLEWNSVTFQELGMNAAGERTPTYWMTVQLEGGAAAATFELDKKSGELDFGEQANPLLPTGKVSISKSDKGHYQMSGQIDDSSFEVSLVEASVSKHKLTGRGYRWINEVPYNR